MLLTTAFATPASAATIWEVGKPQGHIESREDLPSPKEFYHKYYRDEGGPFGKMGRPVLFRGAARPMPAFQLWTDDYLSEQHGHVKMDQVETEKRETRSKFPHEDWTLKKFLNKYNTSDIYSTASTPKGLSDEVFMLPPINCGGFQKKLAQSVTWFSSGGTRSVIHNDGQLNFHCMIAGSKRWILWHPESRINTPKFGWVQGEQEAKKDKKFKNTYGTFVGHIDVDKVDLKRFPGWDELKWWELNLVAGDCAFIPPAWFHFVEAAAGRSISVHAWFSASSKFDEKSCEAMVAKGYNISDYLIRFSDCEWGHEPDNPKKTKCRIRKSLASKGEKKEEGKKAKEEL